MKVQLNDMFNSNFVQVLSSAICTMYVQQSYLSQTNCAMYHVVQNVDI